MSCEEIENRILDCQEHQLSPAQRGQLEDHLAGCAGCRMFAQQLQQLDAALSAGIKAPALSTDFGRRLRERIKGAPVPLSEAQRAERKRQLQVEFEAGIAQIRRLSFAPNRVFSHLTWPALAGLSGWLAWRVTSQLTAHPAATPSLLPWFAAGAVFMVLSLPEAFPRQWKNLWG